LKKDQNYAPTVLYQFSGTNFSDGCEPFGRISWGGDGHLLGTTYSGGDFGAGAVYELVHRKGSWQAKLLHSFDFSDGIRPQSGLITDHKGNWFGTTSLGGKYKSGTVFEISVR
jgi:hypothetical protein